jgi:hypothetical protein
LYGGEALPTHAPQRQLPIGKPEASFTCHIRVLGWRLVGQTVGCESGGDGGLGVVEAWEWAHTPAGESLVELHLPFRCAPTVFLYNIGTINFRNRSRCIAVVSPMGEWPLT